MVLSKVELLCFNSRLEGYGSNPSLLNLVIMYIILSMVLTYYIDSLDHIYINTTHSEYKLQKNSFCKPFIWCV